jgi:hypothetical protein
MTAQRVGVPGTADVKSRPVLGATFSLTAAPIEDAGAGRPLAATRMANPHAMYTCTKDEEQPHR